MTASSHSDLLTSPIDFSTLTVELIRENLEAIKTLYVDTYNTIAALDEKDISFETAVQPLINLEILVAKIDALCTVPKEMHPKKEIRDAANTADTELEKIKISCRLREDVFHILKIYEATFLPRDEERLSAEEIRYVKNIMLTYKRDGLYLTDPRIKKRMTEIKERLSTLCIHYSENLDNATVHFDIPRENLSGLPDSWFTKDREVSPGIYKVTHNDQNIILEYASNREIRKRLFNACESLCEKENLPHLNEILHLRYEQARLLGYATHADYVAEIRIAKSRTAIETFIDDLIDKFKPLLKENLDELTNFAAEREGDPDFKLEMYDMKYYMRLYGEATCHLDMNEVKEYFPFQTVIEGTLKLYEELLGLKFTRNESVSTWDESVMAYDVCDQKTEVMLGTFYLDLYPREGKNSNPRIVYITDSCDISKMTGIPDQRTPSLPIMLCGFPKNENLGFQDVISFFHEFGHVMHRLCIRAKLPAYRFFIPYDFIEAPAKMLENWPLTSQALEMLSRHPETQRPLPKELIDKIIQKGNLFKGYVQTRQLAFAKIDFLTHLLTAEELDAIDFDLKLFAQQEQHKALTLPLLPETCLLANFWHIVNNYDVGYYGYIWADVYAADMFASYFKENPLSRESGDRYRRLILEPGGSIDPADLMFNFLGRDPRMAPFLKQCGVAVSASATEHSIFRPAKEEKYGESPALYSSSRPDKRDV